MSRRKHAFGIGEYYHCFNRGTDKRVVFTNAGEYDYFLKSLHVFNSTETLGKLRLQQHGPHGEKIVELLAYSLLPNHFHLVLQENVENGISKFMQRLSISYTMFFNKTYKRSGVLFQGPFKSNWIKTDQNLRQVIAYVGHNQLVHTITDKKLYRSGFNLDHPLVRDPYSCQNYEILEIIKNLRKENECN